jgi:hypothetical protein
MYRYGTIFRQAIDTKKIEMCDTFEGINTNPLMILVVNLLKDKMPGMIHKCPYTGDWNLTNFTINRDLLDKTTMLFPAGVYRCDVTVYYRDIKSFNLSMIAEIKSELRESFG